MKTVIASVLIVLMGVSSGFCQRRPQVRPKIKDKPYYSVFQLGFSNPTSPERFKDFWSFGIVGSLGIDKKITPFYALNATVMCNTVIFDDEEFVAKIGGYSFGYESNKPLEILGSVMINGKYTPEPNNELKAYFFGGLGLVYRDEGKIQYKYPGYPYTLYPDGNGKTETVFGFDFGLGTEYYITLIKSEFIFEAKVVAGFTSGGTISFIPVTIGFRF